MITFLAGAATGAVIVLVIEWARADPAGAKALWADVRALFRRKP